MGKKVSLVFHPDGRFLATGSSDYTTRIWDLESQYLAVNPTVLRGHDGRVNALSINPVDDVLATGSQDRTVRLWIFASQISQPIWEN
jgi:WD40 repeat protein